ncbi:MAG TPA: hypothetical protein VIR16_09830 [Candidatus Limnocylindrales bacterium]
MALIEEPIQLSATKAELDAQLLIECGGKRTQAPHRDVRDMPALSQRHEVLTQPDRRTDVGLPQPASMPQCPKATAELDVVHDAMLPAPAYRRLTAREGDTARA